MNNLEGDKSLDKLIHFKILSQTIRLQKTPIRL
jgi:hypothetical protein